MWCLSSADSQRWCAEGGYPVGASGHPVHDAAAHIVTVPLSPLTWPRLTWFSGFVGSAVEPYDECLLWVTQWGVWPSSENWHLFYRLRETYGERRPLRDAPGHLFLAHETSDLANFVALALVFGWDFHLVPHPRHASVFVSHDEFLHLYADDAGAAAAAETALRDAQVDLRRG